MSESLCSPLAAPCPLLSDFTWRVRTSFSDSCWEAAWCLCGSLWVRSGAGALLRKAFPVVAPAPGSLPSLMTQGEGQCVGGGVYPAKEKLQSEEGAHVLAETQDWS